MGQQEKENMARQKPRPARRVALAEVLAAAQVVVPEEEREAVADKLPHSPDWLSRAP